MRSKIGGRLWGELVIRGGDLDQPRRTHEKREYGVFDSVKGKGWSKKTFLG